MDATEVLNQMSTSRFLKGKDIEGKRVNVVIDSVELQEQDRDGKKTPQFVLHLRNSDKLLGLNVGNTEVVIENLGSETNNWVDKQLTLYTEKTQTPDGNPTVGIRVEKQYQGEVEELEQVSATEQSTTVTDPKPADPEHVDPKDIPF